MEPSGQTFAEPVEIMVPIDVSMRVHPEGQKFVGTPDTRPPAP
jgi:hypothetical protein